MDWGHTGLIGIVIVLLALIALRRKRTRKVRIRINWDSEEGMEDGNSKERNEDSD